MRTSLFSWVDSLQITNRRPLFRALVVSGGLLWSAATAAQTPAITPDSPLPGLLAERKTLTDRYTAASAQRHSLFGNKPSKKDLQEVVDALQGIMDKDQQIVDVLNRTAQAAQTNSVRLAATTTHLETSSRDDRNLTAQRLSELTNEAENLHQREKQQLAKMRDLEAEVTEAKQSHFVRDALIAGLAVLCVGLVVALRRRK
ncbi:vacuolar-type H+-ATPase subunit I/STV1 [Hymenobacter sp. UYAg731]